MDPSERAQLAEYQARLLDILHGADSTAAALANIRTLAAEIELAEMQSPDPRMVAVAVELVQRWGVKKRPPMGDAAR